MFCSRCGKPVPEAVAYCPACGAPVVSPPSGAASAGAAGLPGPGATGAGPVTGSAGPTATPSAGSAIHYGGFWRRLVAFLIDGLILGAVMTPFGLGMWGTMAGLGHLAGNGVNTLPALIAASMFAWCARIIVSWLYGALFESSAWQATPGKKALGLRVTDLEGRRISFARATGRALGKWLSGLILCIGYLMVAFTERKQGLHDMLAGTVVRR